MQSKISITLDDFYTQMCEGKISKRKLEDEIYRFFLKDNRFAERVQKSAADFCDFLCSIYPKISRAIDNYTDKGSTFEAYISVIIFYSLKEEKFKEHKRAFLDNLCFQESRREMLVSETSGDYEPFNPIDNGNAIARKSINRSAIRALRSNSLSGREKAWVKLIIIMLKSYTIIEPRHIEAISKITGITSEELYRLIDGVKAKRFEADTNLMMLKDRVHTQYYKCLAYETKLRKTTKEDYYYKKIAKKLNRAKETLNNMRFRLKHKRVDATNKQISDVLGIPKGSVDFCISSIRHNYKRRLCKNKNRSH
ncbi:MAG: hypothetical protein LBD20_01625 [Spirochaetaceae bacterium]|jgi:hypothetical protein|nr:hypothetical protein [Spirochaetaceae bacterium]